MLNGVNSVKRILFRWVDLGYREDNKIVAFAKKNIGAASATDAGYYFRWGELNGWKVNQAAGTGTVTINSVEQQACVRDGSWANDKNTEMVAANVFSSGKWPLYKDNKCQELDTLCGVTDKTYNGARYGDAARYNWGGSWRMMTDVEVKNFQTSESGTGLSTSWSTCYGYSGVDKQWGTSPAGMTVRNSTLGTSIFLPAAGRCEGGSLLYFGTEGYYWSAVPYSANLSYCLSLRSSVCGQFTNTSFCGMPVRPVALLTVEVDNDYFEDSINNITNNFKIFIMLNELKLG